MFPKTIFVAEFSYFCQTISSSVHSLNRMRLQNSSILFTAGVSAWPVEAQSEGTELGFDLGVFWVGKLRSWMQIDYLLWKSKWEMLVVTAGKKKKEKKWTYKRIIMPAFPSEMPLSEAFPQTLHLLAWDLSPQGLCLWCLTKLGQLAPDSDC